MSQVYYIVGWHQHYENWASGRSDRPKWICQSTNLRHDSYLALTDLGDSGAAIYGCFRSILALAANCVPHGILCARGARTPYTCADIARRVSWSETLISDAIQTCLRPEIGLVGAADSVEQAMQLIGTVEFEERRKSAALGAADGAAHLQQPAQRQRSSLAAKLLPTRQDKTRQKRKKQPPSSPPEEPPGRKPPDSVPDAIGYGQVSIGLSRETAGELVERFGVRRFVEACDLTAEARRTGKVHGNAADYLRGVARNIR